MNDNEQSSFVFNIDKLLFKNQIILVLSFGTDEQCRSMLNKGCAIATFAVKSALQLLHKHNQEAYVLFVDLVKAYNSVNRELLQRILNIFGVPEKLIIILKNCTKTLNTS